MFSVNNFYTYLNQHIGATKKDISFKSFSTHGSRLLNDIIAPTFPVDNSVPPRYAGSIVMFDQEPIEMPYFHDWINFNSDTWPANEGFEYRETGDLYKNLTPDEFVFRHFSGVYNPILCHSERNSDDVELFKQNHFHPVHYFYHGLIARDWFRHWKHYSMLPGTQSKRLGMYARDASGSREYRVQLLHKLVPVKNDLYFELQDPIYNIDPSLNLHYKGSDVEYTSDASAMIVPEDCAKFDIQIVPETLFDTQKTHLTEKVFKPIVMKQPFIIAGCPNSLEYLKSYGFKTFDGLWDESYDKETDSNKRMDMIADVVQYLADLDEADYRRLLAKAQSIISYNHSHFFSERFENIMLDELHWNLSAALLERNEEFTSMPGGTWFMYMDKLYREGHDISDFNRGRNFRLANYLWRRDPAIGREVMKRYSHLFPIVD